MTKQQKQYLFFSIFSLFFTNYISTSKKKYDRFSQLGNSLGGKIDGALSNIHRGLNNSIIGLKNKAKNTKNTLKDRFHTAKAKTKYFAHIIDKDTLLIKTERIGNAINELIEDKGHFFYKNIEAVKQLFLFFLKEINEGKDDQPDNQDGPITVTLNESAKKTITSYTKAIRFFEKILWDIKNYNDTAGRLSWVKKNIIKQQENDFKKFFDFYQLIDNNNKDTKEESIEFDNEEKDFFNKFLQEDNPSAQQSTAALDWLKEIFSVSMNKKIYATLKKMNLFSNNEIDEDNSDLFNKKKLFDNKNKKQE